MTTKIQGTEHSKALIHSIIGKFRTNKPRTSNIDYSMHSDNLAATLHTSENRGVLRNVSLINMPGINAAVGNESGAILITQKPFFMFAKTAAEKITRFLELISPENIAKTADITHQGGEVNHMPFTKVVDSMEFKTIYRTQDGDILERTVHGQNAVHMCGEVRDDYRKL